MKEVSITKCKSLLSIMLTIIILLLLGITIVFAQEDLETTLNDLSEDAAKSYVNPLTNGYGAAMNAGWFHKAPKAKVFGIDIEFGIVGMIGFLGEENKTFSTTGNFRFNVSQAEDLTDFIYTDQAYDYLSTTQKQTLQDELIEQITEQYFSVGIFGPTVVGKKDEFVKLQFNEKTIIATDPATGQNINVNVPAKEIITPARGILDGVTTIPHLAPQLSIGTVYGTELKIRYLPSIETTEEIGTIDYFGFGIQHNLGVWLKNPLPVDIAIGYFQQKLTVGDVMEATGSGFGIHASKSFPFITPYAGFIIESSNVTFTYNYEVETSTGVIPQSVKFDLEGENSTRFTFGATVNLLIIKFSADYSIGAYNSASLGLWFGF